MRAKRPDGEMPCAAPFLTACGPRFCVCLWSQAAAKIRIRATIPGRRAAARSPICSAPPTALTDVGTLQRPDRRPAALRRSPSLLQGKYSIPNEAGMTRVELRGNHRPLGWDVGYPLKQSADGKTWGRGALSSARSGIGSEVCRQRQRLARRSKSASSGQQSDRALYDAADRNL